MSKEMILSMLGIPVDTSTVRYNTYCANVVHTTLTASMYNAFILRQLNEYFERCEKLSSDD